MRCVFRLLLVPLALALFTGASQARDLTDQEVSKIVVVLSNENCELEIANPVGTNYEVSAGCTDGKSYTYILDKDFRVVKKTTKD